jgi:hypothetical protein
MHRESKLSVVLTILALVAAGRTGELGGGPSTDGLRGSEAVESGGNGAPWSAATSGGGSGTSASADMPVLRFDLDSTLSKLTPRSTWCA